MRNIWVFLFAILSLASCNQSLYDINYKGEENYKSFYVVDTIRIENPVRVYPKKHDRIFILSKDKLKAYRGEADFFMSPDIFLSNNYTLITTI